MKEGQSMGDLEFASVIQGASRSFVTMEIVQEIAPFKLGDIVRLKSGGPDMRAIGFSPNRMVWCDWDSKFIGHKDEASFPPECLDKIT